MPPVIQIISDSRAAFLRSIEIFGKFVGIAGFHQKSSVILLNLIKQALEKATAE